MIELPPSTAAPCLLESAKAPRGYVGMKTIHTSGNAEKEARKVRSRVYRNLEIQNPRKAWFDDLGRKLVQALRASRCDTIALDGTTLRNQDSSHSFKTSRPDLEEMATDIPRLPTVSHSCPDVAFETLSRSEPVWTSDEASESINERMIMARLLLRHSRVSHMVLTDASYKVFISRKDNGALCYKIHNKVAVVCGDPLSERKLYKPLLQEFQSALGLSNRHIAFLGMSENFAEYAMTQRWITLNFGIERFTNPLTNSILEGTSSKRIYTQARQLLDPRKGCLELELYNPSSNRNTYLESLMMKVYEDWRRSREDGDKIQSYLTLLDFDCYPGEIFYLIVKNGFNEVQGFAGLRRLGEEQGYHLDPCIESAFGPRGVADLLTIASMALLKSMGVRGMSLGYEPSTELYDATRLTTSPSRVLQPLYCKVNQMLHLQGKCEHHNRFKPDDSQNAQLHLIFPMARLPRLQQLLAITATVHLDSRHLLKGILLAGQRSIKSSQIQKQ